MLNRYSFNFDTMVWQHIRISIQSKGKNSIWYKLLFALSSFFAVLLHCADYVYSNIFLEYMDIDSLRKVAKHYNLSQIPGESINNFRIRIQIFRSLLSEYCSVALMKRIIMITCGVEPVILQYRDYTIFTIGVTPLGEGVCMNSLYSRFVWKAMLPDLSNESIDRNFAKSLIEQFNLASNEFVIIEQRGNEHYIW